MGLLGSTILLLCTMMVNGNMDSVILDELSAVVDIYKVNTSFRKLDLINRMEKKTTGMISFSSKCRCYCLIKKNYFFLEKVILEITYLSSPFFSLKLPVN